MSFGWCSTSFTHLRRAPATCAAAGPLTQRICDLARVINLKGLVVVVVVAVVVAASPLIRNAALHAVMPDLHDVRRAKQRGTRVDVARVGRIQEAKWASAADERAAVAAAAAAVRALARLSPPCCPCCRTHSRLPTTLACELRREREGNGLCFSLTAQPNSDRAGAAASLVQANSRSGIRLFRLQNATAPLPSPRRRRTRRSSTDRSPRRTTWSTDSSPDSC